MKEDNNNNNENYNTFEEISKLVKLVFEKGEELEFTLNNLKIYEDNVVHPVQSILNSSSLIDLILDRLKNIKNSPKIYND